MLVHVQEDAAAAYAAETAILNDESLSYQARGILLRILRKAPEWKVNAKDLSAAARQGRGLKGESVDKIRSYFRELERAGYLVRDYVRMGGRGYGTQLSFYDTRQALTPATPAADLPEGHVAYVIGEPGGSKVKIGQTRNLQHRMGAYQTHSPVALEVLWTHLGGLVLERILHQEFESLRVHGEWFDFGDMDPVAAIECFVRTIDADKYAAVERQMMLNRLIDGESAFVWKQPGEAA